MKKARYLIEFYKDEYNSLHQSIEIDLKEDERTDGEYSAFIRGRVNPNLTICYMRIYLNGNRIPIRKERLIGDTFIVEEICSRLKIM